MGVKNSEVYHTILQNQDHCLNIELKNVFHLRLQAQTMPVQFVMKPKRKLNSKHISYHFLVEQLEPYAQNQYRISLPEFIKTFKGLILRRGKPKIVYSDNAKTFKAEAKWLANINKDQKLHDFFSCETIIWKFNVPKAPWWGGQFERLIDLIKARLYRTIGKAKLTWAELEEVLLNIKIILNNRSLTYIEEEIDYLILIPNSCWTWSKFP